MKLHQSITDKIHCYANIIMKVSFVIIISNSFGAMVFLFLGFGSSTLQAGSFLINPISFLFVHFIQLCFTMIALGVLFAIGAYQMKKLRLWANKLLSLISLFLILAIWFISLATLIGMRNFDATLAAKFIAIATAIAWTIPFICLIQYLNRKDVKNCFK